MLVIYIRVEGSGGHICKTGVEEVRELRQDGRQPPEERDEARVAMLRYIQDFRFWACRVKETTDDRHD